MTATQLADAVQERMDAMGLSRTEVRRRGGPTNATLQAILNAQPGRYKGDTLQRLDDALRWVPGSSQGLLYLGLPEKAAEMQDEYEPITADSTVGEALAVIANGVAQMVKLLTEIQRNTQPIEITVNSASLRGLVS